MHPLAIFYWKYYLPISVFSIKWPFVELYPCQSFTLIYFPFPTYIVTFTTSPQHFQDSMNNKFCYTLHPIPCYIDLLWTFYGGSCCQHNQKHSEHHQWLTSNTLLYQHSMYKQHPYYLLPRLFIRKYCTNSICFQWWYVNIKHNYYLSYCPTCWVSQTQNSEKWICFH